MSSVIGIEKASRYSKKESCTEKSTDASSGLGIHQASDLCAPGHSQTPPRTRSALQAVLSRSATTTYLAGAFQPPLVREALCPPPDHFARCSVLSSASARDWWNSGLRRLNGALIRLLPRGRHLTSSPQTMNTSHKAIFDIDRVRLAEEGSPRASGQSHVSGIGRMGKHDTTRWVIER